MKNLTYSLFISGVFNFERALNKTLQRLELEQLMNGQPLLHAAVKNNSDSEAWAIKLLMRFFILTGADPNQADNEGKKLLHHASKKDDKEIVQILLSAGAGLSPADNKRRTPLHDAARKGGVRIVELLVNAGADPN